MDLAKLRTDSRELLERLADRLPQDKLNEYRSLSDVGEWAILVDLLSATLVKRNIPITPAERDALADLLALFPTTVEDLDYITHRDQTLAALTVTTQHDTP